MINSALHNKLRVTVAGWHEEKTYQAGSHPHEYHGPKMGKPAALLECVKSIMAVDADAVVMIVDGFDILFQKGEADILAAYQGPSILYSAEKGEQYIPCCANNHTRPMRCGHLAW
jgi:hypothetical protein